MPGLIDYLPDADALGSLAPEDLGMILLDLMHRVRGPNPAFTQSDFVMPIWNANATSFPIHRKEDVNRAIAEAWQWLGNEGLVMAKPDSNGWFCLTRKGASLKSRIDVDAYRQGNILPVAVLHPNLVGKVRPMFIRGDYDVAVVQAFKIVEVYVREAASLPDELVGQKLMRTAYNPETGPLADMSTPAGERQAVMELFSGAIGHGRNPASHRDVAISRTAAAQLIGLASYLLSLVDDWQELRR
ncbi:TIGR02391 family protein [Bradyrhizobium erythrophlei]|jgi:uncharacterized protein (TIGR02391 family)|uniref:TIGR02391 family protein n=1 Tax=Bradyrhizobium erythrophlei TaxID=1437360 RepID=A0A1M7URF1_9BRAD|nr:TIGR02391 family protein [Bradyrhizobium erythrophlei]SHN85529.1 TIGR02391 family protein [Bradyrhizobium erythrophlei]